MRAMMDTMYLAHCWRSALSGISIAACTMLCTMRPYSGISNASWLLL